MKDSNRFFGPERYGYMGMAVGTNGEIIHLSGQYIAPINQYNYIVQQFTGLKDKNGKEIYDGDIVKLHHTWETKEPHISEVMISFDGIATIEPHPEHTNGNKRALQNFTWEEDYCVSRGFATCEIIGNIFENPELMIDKK